MYVTTFSKRRVKKHMSYQLSALNILKVLSKMCDNLSHNESVHVLTFLSRLLRLTNNFNLIKPKQPIWPQSNFTYRHKKALH